MSSTLSSVMAPLGIAGVWTKTGEKLLEPAKEGNRTVEVKTIERAIHIQPIFGIHVTTESCRDNMLRIIYLGLSY